MKIWAIFLTAAVALAQTPTAALKSVIGEVTSIDAGAKQIKLRADNGATYTVTLDENTSYLRIPPGETDVRKASKIAFTDISAGDRLLARGALSEETKTVPARTVIIITKKDLAQKQERDRAEWQRRGITAIVTAVNPAAQEITATTRGRDSASLIIEAAGASFRRYAPDSVRFADAKPSSIAEVQVGDTVRVLGQKSEDGSRYKAEEVIAGAFQTIAATVISADAGAGEVRLTDLQTKKQVTVRITPGTLLRRIDEGTATMLARRLRPASATADAGGAGGPGGPAGAGGGGAGRAGGADAAGPGRGFAGGFRGGGPGGNFDLQQVLERSPQLSLSELKKGDAVIVSSAKAGDGVAVTAFSFVAGVEPFLAAAPRTAGQVNLGSWNLETGGIPEQ
ncbi:MAG TPA: hypothetical protein VEV17_12780 [Bryobacteraceae bacterium]|nr:hypothetical protein [Bryobacteraceae bacterium]